MRDGAETREGRQKTCVPGVALILLARSLLCGPGRTVSSLHLHWRKVSIWLFLEDGLLSKSVEMQSAHWWDSAVILGCDSNRGNVTGLSLSGVNPSTEFSYHRSSETGVWFSVRL